jgi:hypothetical protein
MKAPITRPYTIGSVTSADGTIIGYRQFGRGPELVTRKLRCFFERAATEKTKC